MFSKRISRVLCVVLLAVASQGCVTYTGVAKDDKGKVYLTGSTAFLVFSQPWVKQCHESGVKLVCVKLDVREGMTPYSVTPYIVPPPAKSDYVH